jgi:hypothetical protein
MSDANSDPVEPDNVDQVDDDIPRERVQSRCRRRQRRRDLRNQLGIGGP